MSRLRVRYYTEGKERPESADVVDVLERMASSFFAQFLARGIELQLEYPACDGDFPAGSLTVHFPEGGFEEERSLSDVMDGYTQSAGPERVSELKKMLQRILLSTSVSDASGSCRPEG